MIELIEIFNERGWTYNIINDKYIQFYLGNAEHIIHVDNIDTIKAIIKEIKEYW